MIRRDAKSILTISILIGGVALLTASDFPKGIGAGFHYQALNHGSFLAPFFGYTEISNRLTAKNCRIQYGIMRGTHAGTAVAAKATAVHVSQTSFPNLLITLNV